MRLDRIRRTIAGCALTSAGLTPFLFGTVQRSEWIPLFALWLGLGLVSARLERPGNDGLCGAGVAVSRALLPLHAFFMLQLVPLPAQLLRLISPGSFAAHFLPDPGDGRFRPISVSQGATVEAWLYVAGLQGLFLAVQGMPEPRRKSFVHALLAVLAVLAGEGLWQSRSAHPYWLYGIVPVVLPSGFETGTFGPYLNRNHFATLMAVGCGLSAGLASTLVRERGSLGALLSRPDRLARAVLLSGIALFFVVVSVASGSRSGALAAIVVVAWFSARAIGKAPVIAGMSVGLAALALSGAAATDRLQRLDLFESRLKPWMDMTTLFRFFPAFGSGFGTFAVTYWPYQRNASYEFWQHAHNDYLQAAIEGGALGILAIGLALQGLRKFIKADPALRDPLLGACGAFALQAGLDLPSHVPANAAVLVCVLALSTIDNRPA